MSSGASLFPGAALAPSAVRDHRGPKQNWILDPLQDTAFIIAAPLLSLGAALAAFALWGGQKATSIIIATHVVFTVAHHLPTFLRIYGDVDLFRRFRWSFLLGPIVPLATSIAVLGYINYKSYPVEYFLYLYLMLVLWDPWHFLRQHYGFMRLYDRHNAAPKRLAARMDLALCVSCFVFIMLASRAWLVELLRDFNSAVGYALIERIPTGAVIALTTAAGVVAVAIGIAYAAYGAWCHRQGYFVSGAKLALFAVTFGVMYLAYTPNAWILSVAPEWTFKVGFAAVGIVHMTQYLAIVWRYNRNLAMRAGRARGGWFARLHGRGGWLIAAGYVLACLAYGELVTTRQPNRWLMSALLAIGFTSTLLHYYFDGFIWKLRHEQNRENLVSVASSGADTHSWWRGNAASVSPRAMLLRQFAYFGVPMLLLTIGTMSVWTAPSTSSVVHMQRAQALSEQGHDVEAGREARLAYASMQKELAVARRVVTLNPTAAHEAELAFLIYNESYYANVVLPLINVATVNRAAHRVAAAQAADLLQHAAGSGAPLAHRGRQSMTRPEALDVLARWRRIAGQDEWATGR